MPSDSFPIVCCKVQVSQTLQGPFIWLRSPSTLHWFGCLSLDLASQALRSLPRTCAARLHSPLCCLQLARVDFPTCTTRAKSTAEFVGHSLLGVGFWISRTCRLLRSPSELGSPCVSLGATSLHNGIGRPTCGKAISAENGAGETEGSYTVMEAAQDARRPSLETQ